MQIAVIRLLLSPFPWDMAGAALAACSSTLHAHVLPRSILTVEKSTDYQSIATSSLSYHRNGGEGDLAKLLNFKNKKSGHQPDCIFWKG